MGAISSFVKASMLSSEYWDSAVDNWFSLEIQVPICDAAGTLDFYIAYDAGGPLDNGVVQ